MVIDQDGADQEKKTKMVINEDGEDQERLKRQHVSIDHPSSADNGGMKRG